MPSRSPWSPQAYWEASDALAFTAAELKQARKAVDEDFFSAE
jgi:hypothetical protein